MHNFNDGRLRFNKKKVLKILICQKGAMMMGTKFELISGEEISIRGKCLSCKSLICSCPMRPDCSGIVNPEFIKRKDYDGKINGIGGMFCPTCRA